MGGALMDESVTIDHSQLRIMAVLIWATHCLRAKGQTFSTELLVKRDWWFGQFICDVHCVWVMSFSQFLTYYFFSSGYSRHSPVDVESNGYQIESMPGSTGPQIVVLVLYRHVLSLQQPLLGWAVDSPLWASMFELLAHSTWGMARRESWIVLS